MTTDVINTIYEICGGFVGIRDLFATFFVFNYLYQFCH